MTAAALPVPNYNGSRQWDNNFANFNRGGSFVRDLGSQSHQVDYGPRYPVNRENSIPQCLFTDSTVLSKNSDNVVMMTTRACISNSERNRYYIVRVLFDSGSKVSFIRTQIGHYLNPRQRSLPQTFIFSRFNSNRSETIKVTSTEVLLYFLPNTKPLSMVIKEIDKIAPSFSSGSLKSLKKPFQNLKVRNLPESIVEVDLLVGMDYYNQIITSSSKIGPNLALHQSLLGQMISGNLPDSSLSPLMNSTTSIIPVILTGSFSEPTLLEKGDQLWDLENIGIKDNPEEVPMKIGSPYEVSLMHAVTPSPIVVTSIAKPPTEVVFCTFMPKIISTSLSTASSFQLPIHVQRYHQLPILKNKVASLPKKVQFSGSCENKSQSRTKEKEDHLVGTGWKRMRTNYSACQLIMKGSSQKSIRTVNDSSQKKRTSARKHHQKSICISSWNSSLKKLNRNLCLDAHEVSCKSSWKSRKKKSHFNRRSIQKEFVSWKCRLESARIDWKLYTVKELLQGSDGKVRSVILENEDKINSLIRPISKICPLEAEP